MWTESTMPLGQSVIVSAMGLTVVFLALIVLALSIMAISKILRIFIKDEAQKPAVASAPAAVSEADQENLAIIMATIGEDLGVTPDQFKIVNVKEIN